MPRLYLRTSYNVLFMIANLIILALLLYYIQSSNSQQRHLEVALQSGEVNAKLREARAHPDEPFGIPLAKWNYDWDGLALEGGEALLGIPPSQVRRLYLIRHGNYDGWGENQGHLNDVGEKQAHMVGQRLRNLSLTFTTFLSSTSKRARETTDIIRKYVKKPSVQYSDDLKEGRPTFPEPKFPSEWQPDEPEFKHDGPRLDRAFRRYIHRSVEPRKNMVTELIVCHGNVIAYFVLRALQVSPQRWMKISIFQGSITILDILPNGQVSLRSLGDVGHLSEAMWTG